MIPLFCNSIISEIESIFLEKIDSFLRINGTRRNMPKVANMTIDYSMFENGLRIDSDDSFSMTVNGTFFDGSKEYQTPFEPVSFQ